MDTVVSAFRPTFRLAKLEGDAAFDAGEGGAEHDRLRGEAEAAGIFGVPTFVLDGELFWGGDRIGLLRERLDEKGVKRRPALG